ncbi:enoyl-CoA hydratase/isomerase [Aquimarina aggregata]|uniref:enoyl-CoA hydratase/isomerase n=1 Tax=Aquimarina aggregata TaxID=1642818 RepID=UPI0024920D15|nr:enoyl-CoA hydratase/isomerase [Aquimarina aggregata]
MITQNIQTVQIEKSANVLRIKIYRPEANNSINAVLLSELKQILREVERDDEVKVIVLEGSQDNFCTGMDFKAVSEQDGTDMFGEDGSGDYYEVLEMFATSSKIIISKIQGKVNAGGIGFVAASDIVLASEKASFGLSEMLFGLLPACVMPFLIRRVGFQKAKWMTLITRAISAQTAFNIGLVDEIGDNLDELLRIDLLRLKRLECDTILDLKKYMNKLWIINDQTKELAVNRISSLMQEERIQNNIKNFVQKGVFPWSK